MPSWMEISVNDWLTPARGVERTYKEPLILWFADSWRSSLPIQLEYDSR